MHERQRSAFVKCQKFLLSNLYPDVSLLRHCEQEKILSDDQIQQVEAETTKNAKVARLLQFVRGANPSKFSTFLDVLKENNQSHVAERIKSEFDEQIKGQPTLPNAKDNIKSLVFSETIFNRALGEDVRQNLIENTVTTADYETVVQQRNRFLAKCDELEGTFSEKLDEISHLKEMIDVYKKELQNQKTLSTKLLSDKEHVCKELRATLLERDEMQRDLELSLKEKHETEMKIEEMENTLSQLTTQKIDLQAEIKEKDNQVQSLKLQLQESREKESTASTPNQEVPIFVEDEQESIADSDDRTSGTDLKESVSSTPDSELSGIWQKLQKVANETQNLQIQLEADENIIESIHRAIDVLAENVTTAMNNKNNPVITISPSAKNEDEESIEDNNYQGWILGGETNQEAVADQWVRNDPNDLDYKNNIEYQNIQMQLQRYKEKYEKARKELQWLKETMKRLRVPSPSSSCCSSMNEFPMPKKALDQGCSVSQLPSYSARQPRSPAKGMTLSKSQPISLPRLAQRQPSSCRGRIKSALPNSPPGNTPPRQINLKLMEMPAPQRVGVTQASKSKPLLNRSKTEGQLKCQKISESATYKVESEQPRERPTQRSPSMPSRKFLESWMNQQKH